VHKIQCLVPFNRLDRTVFFGLNQLVFPKNKIMNAKIRSLLAAFSAIGMVAAFTGCHAPEAKTQAAGAAAAPSSATPCMDVLNLFTAPNVPAFGPDEIAVNPRKPSTNTPPADLPGMGLAQHPMLYVGEGYNKIFLINNGKVIWDYSTGPGNELDDVWMLSNGNILYTRMGYLAEITPDKKVIWRFDCPTNTQVHACQPIGLDRVLFINNGLPPKLMVVNIKTGATEVEHDVPARSLTDPKTIHPQYRRVRYTAQGTYLVPELGMGTNAAVVEYDKNFNEIWRYPIRSPWAAIRLKNGNTLITDEGDKLTREVNPKGETVWEFKADDLPEAYRFASAPQSCTRLANGNTIFCSRGGNGKGPQLVEVTPDKKVVWVLWDFADLGPATAVQILDDPGIPENPGESEH
jgi:outer membrane protein assembly factor BamB